MRLYIFSGTYWQPRRSDPALDKRVNGRNHLVGVIQDVLSIDERQVEHV
jgi:hypothetical protein